MRTNAEDGPVEDFRDDGALGSLFGADGDLSFLDEKERGAATGPAVVIDHVSMVYNVTSTGGGDEVAVPAPVR